jgi:hypothetical protein
LQKFEYILPGGVADVKREYRCYYCVFWKIIKEAFKAAEEFRKEVYPVKLI